MQDIFLQSLRIFQEKYFTSHGCFCLSADLYWNQTIVSVKPFCKNLLGKETIHILWQILEVPMQRCLPLRSFTCFTSYPINNIICNISVLIIITWNYNIRIICKRIPSYIRYSACMWFIVKKKSKIFWSYVKHIWTLQSVRKCRILIVYLR